jgi:hypothetical protein
MQVALLSALFNFDLLHVQRCNCCVAPTLSRSSWLPQRSLVAVSRPLTCLVSGRYRGKSFSKGVREVDTILFFEERRPMTVQQCDDCPGLESDDCCMKTDAVHENDPEQCADCPGLGTEGCCSRAASIIPKRTFVMSQNMSEVALLRKAIQEEYEASSRVFNGFTVTSRHDFIEARQARVSEHFRDLAIIIGHEQALMTIIEITG